MPWDAAAPTLPEGGTTGWGWLPVLGYTTAGNSKIFWAVSPLLLGETEPCSLLTAQASKRLLFLTVYSLSELKF